jgi:hypothetical protein
MAHAIFAIALQSSCIQRASRRIASGDRARVNAGRRASMTLWRRARRHSERVFLETWLLSAARCRRACVASCPRARAVALFACVGSEARMHAHSRSVRMCPLCGMTESSKGAWEDVRKMPRATNRRSCAAEGIARKRAQKQSCNAAPDDPGRADATHRHECRAGLLKSLYNCRRAASRRARAARVVACRGVRWRAARGAARCGPSTGVAPATGEAWALRPAGARGTP